MDRMIRLVSSRTGNHYLSYRGPVPRIGEYVTVTLRPTSVHDPVWFMDLEVQKITYMVNDKCTSRDGDVSEVYEVAVHIKDPRPKVKKKTWWS